MVKVFAVTTAAPTILLDAQGKGIASFTISNTSKRSLRGRTQVKAGDPAQESWYAVEGKAEREFKPNGTYQVTVKVAVPPDTPSGKYSLSLEAFSTDNPDDEFTEGPLVSFEFKAAAPQGIRLAPSILIAVAAAAVFVASFIVSITENSVVFGAVWGIVGAAFAAAEKLFPAAKTGVALHWANGTLVALTVASLTIFTTFVDVRSERHGWTFFLVTAWLLAALFLADRERTASKIFIWGCAIGAALAVILALRLTLGK